MASAFVAWDPVGPGLEEVLVHVTLTTFAAPGHGGLVSFAQGDCSGYVLPERFDVEGVLLTSEMTAFDTVM